ncbi:type II toxin-antitoxin system RelE/ParE family toxin [Winslowiella iniecta]|uniref:Plasmid stabilization protein n=1 Tax=Winslowiella iniecta TaxID=1560201 RepID=A0A0L7SY18_9GAMM|nr:type II toxin-antitoxin system RelE/ParE family toxin [Winslowiella iniecta]KOC88044.1 plasmid stabilization protein [Winslowiella iniecta]KOC88140.1 plasmid stabilization protein [Winslowiella iniecta]
MDYKVVFASEAEEQLAELYRYIAKAATPETALGYTESVIGYCESLERFPHRGNRRDDILTGLRVTNYRKRTIIAFMVRDKTVSILGIWHGGQDYEDDLLADETD